MSPNGLGGSQYVTTTAKGGTGEKLGRIAIIICGVAALAASLISFLYEIREPSWNTLLLEKKTC